MKTKDKSKASEMEKYFKSKAAITLTRIEIIVIITAISYTLDSQRIKKSYLSGMFQSAGKKLVDSLRVKGVIPLSEDQILEWSKRGLV